MQRKYRLFVMLLSELWNKIELQVYLALFKESLQIICRVALVYFWNWIFSAKVNQCLFGEDRLPVIKGVLIFTFFNAILTHKKIISDYITAVTYNLIQGARK